MNVIETDWDWAWALTKRRLPVTELILHHAAASGPAEQIHAFHRAKGWAGIAYHYYVRKDGTVWRGRPEEAVGGHTGGHNSQSIGVCFEGNFQTDVMGEAQLEAGSALVSDIFSRYPDIHVLRHGDVNPTACPGKNFPFEEMTEQMTGEEIYRRLTEYLAAQPESGWSEEEGHWRRAAESGVMDGANPRGFVTREQTAALLGRLGLITDGGEKE